MSEAPVGKTIRRRGEAFPAEGEARTRPKVGAAAAARGNPDRLSEFPSLRRAAAGRSIVCRGRAPAPLRRSHVRTAGPTLCGAAPGASMGRRNDASNAARCSEHPDQSSSPATPPAPPAPRRDAMATIIEHAGSATFTLPTAKYRLTIPIRSRYDNWIGGEYVPPARGQYFVNPTPITGQPLCEVARSTHEDVDRALDAAHAAAISWNATSPAYRANILNRIADRVEANIETLAFIETLYNGKPIRETTHADLPLAVDHLRYFAGCIRAQEGGLSQLDEDTVAYHFHEPLGVVAQIIPWNFPILMATWKLAPALAAGNCVVLKPAEQTPVGIMALMELIADILPSGVVNVVQGFGVEAGKPLASSPRVAKIAFTGETTTGRLIMQYASENLIPVTLELGGKSPNIFFNDVTAEDDDFFDKAIEGFVMFALNQGEVCTCPSRALIQESIYDRFMEKALKRVEAIKQGSPLDPSTMIGAQASSEQMQKILSYIDIGREEGAEVLTGGTRNLLPGDLAGGFYVKPTVFKGNNKMRVFQEEIFGPVVSVTTF